VADALDDVLEAAGAAVCGFGLWREGGLGHAERGGREPQAALAAQEF
jgi:hypothetical protein